jgi:hypothetical protein
MIILKIKKAKGAIIVFTLVFGTIFLMMLGALSGFALFQARLSEESVSKEMAFQIAEAGLNFARWHLNHWPDNFSFGGEYDFKNPEGEIVGKYRLTIEAPTLCNPGTKIISEGWTLRFPDKKRKIQAIYAKPALTKYAFLTNANAWFGSDEELKGPFHSNGGIRMDGEQNSLATSAKQTYICGPEHGCSPPQEKPGIWGQGEGALKGLWQFPVPPIDFNSITQDLAQLKAAAQSSGLYLPENSLGYHLKFRNNGTVDIYRVTRLKSPVWGYDGTQWIQESNDIDEETFLQTYTLSASCAPIYVESNVWVEGDYKGRVTVVAAKLPEMPSSLKKIIISGNINMADNNSALGLIAQKDILIPLYSPDILEIKAALIAQKGHIFRYYYPKWSFEPYRTYAIRSKIETFGAMATNTIWTFTWVNSQNQVVSGYQTTEMSYNPNLTFSPPPYFPVSGEPEMINWDEIQ